MLNEYRFLDYRIFFIVFVFHKSFIIIEITLGDDDQFARRYA